jgi:hypothetical protein
VAGRDAYTLVATPRYEATLVGAVEVAVDAGTGHVLQVSVQARGQAEPAWLAGFTSLDLSAPADSVFELTPAPGTTVVEPQEDAGGRTAEPSPDERAPGDAPARHDVPEPVVHGDGWSTVVELALPEPDEASWEMRFDEGTGPSGAGSPDGEDPRALLEQLTTPVDGGRVLTSALLTVLLTDDGRVLVGAVGPETLLQHAG